MLRRRLLSAALASSLLAADVVLLTLFLNPEVGALHELQALALSLFLPYWLAGTLLLLALAGLLGLVRVWPAELRPGVPGLPSFTTFALIVLGGAGALFWGNLVGHRDSLPLESLAALRQSVAGIALFAALLLAVAVNAWLRPRRQRGASAALAVLSTAAALIVPLAARPTPRPAASPVPLRTDRVVAPRRVVLVGIDGLSPELVRSSVERGRQPALSRLLRRGTHGALRTLVPTEGPPIWTTIATGRLPRDHGVKSFTRYRLRGSATLYDLLPKGALVSWLERAGLVARVPLTADSRRRRSVWEALNGFGIPVGVVRLFGTHPAEKVQGFMLSNYFHLLRRDPARARQSLFPPDLLAEVQARALDAPDLDRALVARFIERPAESARDRVPWRSELLERALAPDLTYERAGRVLRAAYDPPFFATYFYGLDVVGHSFLRFAQPEDFGDVAEAQARRYGAVRDAYVALLAERVAELADGLRGDDVLLVVSGYGMRPAPPWRRLLGAISESYPASGEHAGGSSGFLLAVGAGVRAGARIEGASVLDIAPTLLYLMGLPVARDMEGRALTELLRPELGRAQPVSFIPSYESLAVTPAAAPLDRELPPLPDEVP
jgi:predicted AlkP superfamily phosphohydrolase/phosphomutase